MRYISSQIERNIRIVALSSSIANAIFCTSSALTDLAAALGAEETEFTGVLTADILFGRGKERLKVYAGKEGYVISLVLGTHTYHRMHI
jgi:hypothetical protein